MTNAEKAREQRLLDERMYALPMDLLRQVAIGKITLVRAEEIARARRIEEARNQKEV